MMLAIRMRVMTIRHILHHCLRIQTQKKVLVCLSSESDLHFRKIGEVPIVVVDSKFFKCIKLCPVHLLVHDCCVISELRV